jgi:type I restriction enzyme R subunit
MAADVAVRIDDAIQSRLVVDWRTNADRQNDMRNAIDDLLYDVKSERGLPLTVEDMDAIIERSLDIAKNRYAR